VDADEPYIWDEAKRTANRREHKIDFTAAYRFEWQSAITFVDDREDYGELREVAIGFIGPGLYVLTFTRRSGKIRVISLRKAAKNDVSRYVEANR
jgi:uncharacterized protein